MKAFKQFFVEQSEEKTLMVLVGPPAIGKSTWIKQNAPDAFVINSDETKEKIAGQLGLTYDDLFAEPDQSLPFGAVAGDNGENEAYGEIIKKGIDPDTGQPQEGWIPDWVPEKLWSNIVRVNAKATDVFEQRFPDAITSGQDIILDLTNLDSEFRERLINKFGDAIQGYRRVAVVFNFQGSDVQQAIKNLARTRSEEIKAQGRSKTIPDKAFDRMFTSYEEPTKEEGYDEVINVDDRQRLLQSL